MSKFICLGSLALTALLLAGCSGTSVDLYPVSGTVTVDGKPMEGITVTLLGPAIEGERLIPYGRTDAEGKYSLKVSDTEVGAPAGQYDVLFQKLTMPDGSPIPEGQTAADVGAVNQIAERYSAPGNSSESATITEGGTTSLDFDLQAKR